MSASHTSGTLPPIKVPPKAAQNPLTSAKSAKSAKSATPSKYAKPLRGAQPIKSVEADGTETLSIRISEPPQQPVKPQQPLVEPTKARAPVPVDNRPPVMDGPPLSPVSHPHVFPNSLREDILGDIAKYFRTFEEKLRVKSTLTVERAVGPGENRDNRFILLRTDIVRLEKVVDEEKETLRRDLVQARRDNAALYILLNDKRNQERVPAHVKTPQIPRLDLESDRRRRLKKETAERLRSLEDVLPRGFILKEIINTNYD